MALRQCMRLAQQGLQRPVVHRLTSRYMSSSPQIILEKDTDKGIATMKFNKKPVNSLNLEMLHDIVNKVDEVEKDKSLRGLILTSNHPGIFTAGLDIMEMFGANEDQLRDFWMAGQDMWLRLYGSSLICMAAINGHSPAAGCLISLCCDYRVMASGKFTIGLNETKLGIVAPTWFMSSMTNTVGHRETELALQTGHLYSGEEAHKVGLIDKLVAPEEVMPSTLARMDQWLRIPDIARQASKMAMRRNTLEHLLKHRKEDTDNFIKFITKDSVQKFLGMYLESLQVKSKK